MSPREPNDDWRVFSAISMIYGIAEQSFVKQVTPDRFFWRIFAGFLDGRSPGTNRRLPGWHPVGGCRLRQGQAMGQKLQPWRKSPRPGESWRSGNGERRWLSLLVDAMEEFSRPDIRSVPCHPSLLVAARAQLAHPVSSGASHFGLRN